MRFRPQILFILLSISLVSTGCLKPSLKGKALSLTTTASSNPLTFSPSSGPIGTLVTLSGIDFSSLTSASIGGTQAIILSLSSTNAQILIMPGTTYDRITLTGVSVAQTSDFFTVTTAIAPANQQGVKLVGTGNVGGSNQGYSVALSGDGNTALIGGFQDNANQGAAWVFTRSGGVWSQQGAKLVGTGAVGTPRQGYSVSLSSDGNTAIIGGYTDNTNQGAAWVFTRSAGVWTQEGPKLVGTGNTGAAQQGTSVALSGDGNTAILGGAADGGASGGAAWVFTRSGGVWTQQGAKLMGTGYVGSSRQGHSVALSGDGNTAIVGGHQDNGNEGAVWVFTRSAGVWTQQGAKLVGTGNTSPAWQGYNISLSIDGNTALVGGSQDNGGQGAAWVFTRSAGVWTQQGAKLVGTGNTGAATQGLSVSLSSSGDVAILGGFQDNGAQGAAWVFTRSAGVWTQQGAKLVGTGGAGTPQQGVGVAISGDGSTALSGANGDNGSIGAGWVFVP